MIIPVKFLWEQLDGPQVTGITEALFQYYKDMLDTKLDYFNNLNVDTANDDHLTFLGILANIVRPIITVADTEFFTLTEHVEHDNILGFSSVNDRSTGGKLRGEDIPTEARAISTEHYRTLLKAFVDGEGELGGLVLLDDICYALSKLDNPEKEPSYTFTFLNKDNIEEGRALGDVYIDIGTMSDWNNPLQIYAILRGLAYSAYWPVPQLFISIDTAVTLPLPTASLPSGSYEGPQQVSLHDGIQIASLYYTTDGSNPTTESSRYEGSITISKSTILKVRAIAAGYNSSDIAVFNYTIV